jgi:hypothetical protein
MWIPIRLPTTSIIDTKQQKIKVQFVCENCKLVEKKYPVLWIDGGNMYWCSMKCYNLWNKTNNIFEEK